MFECVVHPQKLQGMSMNKYITNKSFELAQILPTRGVSEESESTLFPMEITSHYHLTSIKKPILFLNNSFEWKWLAQILSTGGVSVESKSKMKKSLGPNNIFWTDIVWIYGPP